MKQNNKEFRKTIRKEHNELLAVYEENKKAQLGRWRLRTANSPLRLDQNEIHRHLMDDWKQHFRREKKHKEIKAELRKMTGKPEFDICSDKYLRSIDDPEKKLAMERRRLLLEANAVKQEKRILTQMVESSISDCERMFPKVAMQIAHGHATSGMSIQSHLVSKQKVSAEEAARLKQEDQRVYSAAGRYDEFGRFILTDSLKTKAGMVSAEYAQASGKTGISNEFQMVNSYSTSLGSGGKSTSGVGFSPSRQGSLAMRGPPSRQGSMTSGASGAFSPGQQGARSGSPGSPNGESLRGFSPNSSSKGGGRDPTFDIGARSLDSMTLSSNEPEPSI
jgi:hypothetical protein